MKAEKFIEGFGNDLTTGRSTTTRQLKSFAAVCLLALTVLSSGYVTARAATLTVTKIEDTRDGICDSDCSLRDAIAVAAPNDTIQFSTFFDTPRTIVLSENFFPVRELLINKSLTIAGKGANLLTIQRPSGIAGFNIFTISGATTTVTLSGMTITGGDIAGDGGGINNSNSTLTVSGCHITNNKATGTGAGIRNSNGTVTIINSTISNNIASESGSGKGGALHNSGGTMNITNSTVSGNINRGLGGGGRNAGAILSATSIGIISGQPNQVFTGRMTITNSTITDNQVDEVNSAGGIYNQNSGTNLAFMTIRNTIIANRNNSTKPDVGGDNFTSQGYNLVGNAGIILGFNQAGDQIGTSGAPLNPRLDALSNYGGTTPTHRLQAESPAIDKGSSFGSTTDQRGSIRPFDIPNIPSIDDSSDIGAFELSTQTVPTTRTKFDFDGDGKADISVFRLNGGNWFRLNSANNSFTAQQFGLATDKLAPADYDGDGRTDLAVFRDGAWYILQSSNGQFRAVNFGTTGDLPGPGDFDGDQRADIAVFRPSSGTWFYLQSSNNQFRAVQFGLSGDVPMIADFDADGKSDITVFRPSDGTWYRINSSNEQFIAAQFGAAGDIPISGDFNGDGRNDLAVYRPSNGFWYIARPTGIPSRNFDATQFGIASDIPVAADYDGDGKTDIAVYRNGNWLLLRSVNNQFGATQFGLSTDRPVQAAYTEP